VLLQPLQPLFLGWSGRSDLPLLTAVEAAGAPLALHGSALIAAFYVNELLVRLLPRQEAHTALFWRYSQCVGALAQAEEIAWELRRFERDLLAELGYALALEFEADGTTPIQSGLRYRYDSALGAFAQSRTSEGSQSGASLLALARDMRPGAEQLRELRRLMRSVLLHHLGGRELRSWTLLSDLATSELRVRDRQKAD
jgi:DNA repair protein RecO (recombination protein O)